MLSEIPKVKTESPLGVDSSFESAAEAIYGSGNEVHYIVGSVFADQPGTLKVQFDDGSGDWDAEETKDYIANTPQGFKVAVVSPYYRIKYVNGDTAQGTFRLKVWEVT